MTSIRSQAVKEALLEVQGSSCFIEYIRCGLRKGKIKETVTMILDQAKEKPEVVGGIVGKRLLKKIELLYK